jgi:hypothetical protein
MRGDQERLLGQSSSPLHPSPHAAMEFNFGSHSSLWSRGRLGCGARVFLTLFGLAFFGMGALFIG